MEVMMKKYYLILFIFLLSVLMVAGCNKKEEPPVNSTETVSGEVIKKFKSGYIETVTYSDGTSFVVPADVFADLHAGLITEDAVKEQLENATIEILVEYVRNLDADEEPVEGEHYNIYSLEVDAVEEILVLTAEEYQKNENEYKKKFNSISKTPEVVCISHIAYKDKKPEAYYYARLKYTMPKEQEN